MCVNFVTFSHWIVMFVFKRVTNIDKNRKSDPSYKIVLTKSLFFANHEKTFDDTNISQSNVVKKRTSWGCAILSPLVQTFRSIDGPLCGSHLGPCRLQWRLTKSLIPHWFPIDVSRVPMLHLCKYVLELQELRHRTRPIWRKAHLNK